MTSWTEIELKWTPESNIEELVEELATIKSCLDDDEWRTWQDMNMTSLPTAEIPDDVDTGYPIWAMDWLDNCLVGDSADAVESLDDIREWLADN